MLTLNTINRVVRVRSTLVEWAERHQVQIQVVPDGRNAGSQYVFEDHAPSGVVRQELYDLSDYVVSGNIAGVLWLMKRTP